MAADKTLEILLVIKSDVANLQKVIDGLKDTDKASQEATKSAFGLKEAFEFAGANEVLHRFVETLKQIPERIVESIKSGVEFNAELEKTQIGIAGILRQNAGAKFVDFESAKEEAGAILDLLKNKANELGIDYRAMFEAYTGSVNSMFSGGITNVEKQIDLVTTLNRAMSTMNITGFQAARDTADLLAGMAARTMAGRQIAAGLGMTPEDFDKQLKAAKQTGQLYEFLTNALKGYQEAGQAAGHTFSAEFQRMRNEITDLQTEASRPLFEELKRGMQDLNKELATDEAKAGARELGGIIGWLGEQAIHAADGYLKLMGILSQVKAAIGPAASLVPSIFMTVPDVSAPLADIQAERAQKTLALLQRQIEEGRNAQEIDKVRVTLTEFISQNENSTNETIRKEVANARYIVTHMSEFAGSAQDVTHHLEQSNDELQKFVDKLPEAIAKIGEMAKQLKFAHELAVTPLSEQPAKLAQQQADILAQAGSAARYAGYTDPINNLAGITTALDTLKGKWSSLSTEQQKATEDLESAARALLQNQQKSWDTEKKVTDQKTKQADLDRQEQLSATRAYGSEQDIAHEEYETRVQKIIGGSRARGRNDLAPGC